MPESVRQKTKKKHKRIEIYFVIANLCDIQFMFIKTRGSESFTPVQVYIALSHNIL